jgi:FAD/FMN-containing dehydrogenase
VDTVYAGVTLYPLERAPLERAGEVMRWYRDYMPSAPDDVYGFFAFITVPPAPPFPTELHLRKMAGIIWCYAGPPADGPRALEPATKVGPPEFVFLTEMPYPALQSMFDGIYPPGDQWYWRGDFVRELSDAAVDAYVDHARSLPTMQSTVHLYPIDGAVHRVPNDATAFSHRDAHWSQVVVGVDHDPARAAELKRWTIGFWDAVHPFAAQGGYVNFMMADEGTDRVRASYGDNYDRLRRVKQTYDPTNFFRINHNIAP